MSTVSDVDARPETEAGATAGSLDRYFSITARESTISRELRGGLATFFTMAYIVVLNPLIIGTAPDVTGATLGIPAVAGVTALTAGVMTVLMGAIGRYPIAIAAGLGINSYLAYGVAPRMTWPEAMGLVMIEGVFVTALVLSGVRGALVRAIPASLRTAIGVGIGVFIALVGLVDAGFVRRPTTGTVPVQLGVGGTLQGWPLVVFVAGLLMTAALIARRSMTRSPKHAREAFVGSAVGTGRGALLVGILLSTVLAIVVEAVGRIGPSVAPDGSTNAKGWSLSVPAWPGDVFTLPDFSLLGSVSLTGGISRIGLISALLIVFTLMLTDFFDTLGTAVVVGAEARLLDDHGDLPGLDRVLLVDSLSAVAGGAASASSNTSYIESMAGVGEGARTGLASVVTGALFLVAVLFTPLTHLVPFEASAPALVIVGFLLMTQIRNIDFDDYVTAVPAFITILVMPFTYSITNGIGAGFISYVVLMAATRRIREIHPALAVVALLFVVYFALSPLQLALGIA